MNTNKPNYFQVAQGVWGMKQIFVNIYMIENRNSSSNNNWVLVDAGLKGYHNDIIKMAESLFGKGTQPSAIVLTHGHFDHIGSLHQLLKVWDVPVYAHPLEAPYLTGKSAYPPADPTVGGGMMALMSWMYPNSPIDITDRLRTIKDNERIPEIPEWRVIHTPGHSPGHISLFRELNATMIVGDAFVTTKTESATYVLSFIKKLSGPPKYFTPNWKAAARSVKRIADLEPRIAATGHGKVMMGRELRNDLQELVRNFYDVAVPQNGRYVNQAALTNENGVFYVPPFKTNKRFSTEVFVTSALVGYGLATMIAKYVESKSGS